MTSTQAMPTPAALLVRPYYVFGMVPRPTPPMIIPMPIRHSGSPSQLETAVLIACGWIAPVGPGRGIFEIGTYKGQTCQTFALNFGDTKITTLDLGSLTGKRSASGFPGTPGASSPGAFLLLSISNRTTVPQL